MKTFFPAIRSRADYRRVSSMLRLMRRAARLYRRNPEAVTHLNFATACRDSISAYRCI